MDNQEQPLDAGLNANQDSKGLQITPSIREQWHEVSKWALFFAVIGLLYIGLLVLGLVSASSVEGLGFSIFIMLFAGAFVFIPTWFVFQFSQQIKKAVEQDITPPAEEGFSNLKRLYQFVGILTMVGLALYAMAFLFGLLMMSQGM